MRDYSRLSDPSLNAGFSRPWTESADSFDISTETERRGLQHISLPVGRIMRRLDRQRAAGNIVALLMSAQQNRGNTEAVARAFEEADRQRQRLGKSWKDLITGGLAA